jgi:eukaryotic-like serine/threonine-protein kinase
MLKLALEPPAEPTVMKDELPPTSAESIRVRYFGDYELVEEIARGGMGVVYKARQVSLKRTVALKMILAGDFSSPAMIQRFQTEAEAAARLEHPNIVPVFEIGAHEGHHYFSMGFVEGGSLTRAMTRGKFGSRRATELMMKVAQAVHHAHQRGILHRDLKPGNILLDATGEPHVADFGLAKLLEQDSALTQSFALMGTPSYMAPEQAAGEARQATTAVDIYSLGAIFYELLTGRPPFTGGSALEILVQAREREPAPLQSLSPEVDRDLGVICLKCLEKDPQRRYLSAAAFADDLDRWLSSEPIQARRTTLPERAWKWARRKPVLAGLVFALHLVALAGLIGILWQSGRASRQARRATDEARRANAEAENVRQESTRAENELWNARFSEARALRIAGGSGARIQGSALLHQLVQRPGLTEAQILDLRKEAIAQLALVDVAMPAKWIPGREGIGWAWNSGLDKFARGAGSNKVEICEFPSERVLATFSGPDTATFDQAVFSPDDQLLAVRFSNADGEVRVWRLETRELLLESVCERFGDANMPRIHISPDSRTLVMMTPRGVAVQVIAPGSTRRFLQDGCLVGRVAFSSDSRHIAVLPAGVREAVEIWDANSGETRCSLRPGFNPHEIAWHPDGKRLVVGGDRGKLEMRTFAVEPAGTNSVDEPFPLSGHLGFIDRIVLAPDGSTGITNSWDSSSIAWDFISCRPLLREQRMIFRGINSSGDRVNVVQEQPMKESVAALIQRTGYRTVAWSREPRASNGVWMSPDGRLIVVNRDSTISQTEGDCSLWDFSRGVEIACLKGVWAQFSADSRKLFTFERYAENRVRCYDTSVETLANRPASWSEGMVVYEGRPGEQVNTGIMAPDGRTLAIAATDAVIFLDTVGSEPTRYWMQPAHFISLTNNGKWAATGRHRDPAVLRSAQDGEAVLQLEKYSHVRFSPDSRWLAVVTHASVQLYKPDSLPTACPPIALEAGRVAPPLEFSPDSRMFAVPYNRTDVRLYETATGRELATLSPPNPAPILGDKALEFSADGQWLLAAREDGETVAWNIPVIRGELCSLGLDWE